MTTVFSDLLWHNSSPSLLAWGICYSQLSPVPRPSLTPHCQRASIAKHLVLRCCCVSQGDNKVPQDSLLRTAGAAMSQPAALDQAVALYDCWHHGPAQDRACWMQVLPSPQVLVPVQGL